MLEKVKTVNLLTSELTTATSVAVQPLGTRRTFLAHGKTSDGAGSSTIGIEVSNDKVVYKEVKEFSLTLGTAITSDVYEMNAAWKHVRAVVKTLVGTDAEVTVNMGIAL